MKTIKIRFVESKDSEGKIDYYIQSKKMFGYKYFKYAQSGGAGDTFYYQYRDNNKEMLLNTIINEVYCTVKNHIKVIEYPMLKIY